MKRFHAPLVPVAVQPLAADGQVVGEEGVVRDVVARPRTRRARRSLVAPPAVRQGRPVVLADGVRLDDDVVVAGLGVPAELGAQARLVGGAAPRSGRRCGRAACRRRRCARRPPWTSPAYGLVRVAVPANCPAPALANCGNVSGGSLSEVTLYAPAGRAGCRRRRRARRGARERPGAGEGGWRLEPDAVVGAEVVLGEVVGLARPPRSTLPPACSPALISLPPSLR